ncbi:MAG: GvpL/GvpF family gas vesicle protein [Gemmatimonadota bacterium]|nr:GvpL/GvpF family gas vesicle protein [Gemmatimonadota bacterium]
MPWTVAWPAASAVKLYGVALSNGESWRSPVPATTVLSFRDLAAIVRPAPFERMKVAEAEMEDYTDVVSRIFAQVTILPAPYGTIFKSPDVVQQWLETNHIALGEGLHFVNGRCEARVHITEAEDVERPRRSADHGAAAAECFRHLGKFAAASMPLKERGDPPALLSGAFLVPRETWSEFREQVQEQDRRSTGLAFELTGPWAPFDFVRMEFGV